MKLIFKILAWMFGVMFIIVGLSSLSSSLISGVLYSVVGFILLPISGNLLAKKGVVMSRNLKIGIVIGGILVGGMVAPKSNKPIEQAKIIIPTLKPIATVEVKNNKPKPTVVVTTQKPKSTETKLWEAVDKTLRTRNGVNVDYFSEDGGVIMRFYRDNYLDENHLVKEAYTEFVNYGIEAFKIPELKSVNVQAVVEMTNEYGKKEKESVVIVQMDKETFQKFEWENLRNNPSINIYEVFKKNAKIHIIVPGVMKNVNTSKLWIK